MLITLLRLSWPELLAPTLLVIVASGARACIDQPHVATPACLLGQFDSAAVVEVKEVLPKDHFLNHKLVKQPWMCSGRDTHDVGEESRPQTRDKSRADK